MNETSNIKNIISVMGFDVYSDSLDKINLNPQNTQILNTISPNSYGISTKDPLFRASLKESDYLVLDGVYFALSSIFLFGKNIKKNQGPDIFFHFMERCNINKKKVFFLGSSEETLLMIFDKCKIDYPNINIKTLSPPFKQEFSNKENDEIINTINEFNPDLLLIGMTCPKQEKWAYLNKTRLNCGLICSIGAVFDWYAGNQKNISPIWWKLRMAWLIRTIHRPEILKRYPNIGIFFWHLFLAIIGNNRIKYGKY